jgi:hypothetical protein
MGLVLTKELGFLPVPTWNKEIFLDLWGLGRWVYLTQITGVLINGVDKIYLISVFGSALFLFTLCPKIYQTVHTTLVGQAHYLFLCFQHKEISWRRLLKELMNVYGGLLG